MMKRFALALCLLAAFAAAATEVRFQIYDSRGVEITNRKVSISSLQNFQLRGGKVMVQPDVTIQAGATTNLLPSTIVWTVAGFQTNSIAIIPDTNVVVNIQDISTNLVTYLYTNQPSVAFAAQLAALGVLTTNNLRDLAITVNSEWTGTDKFLLAAASSGEYQMLTASFDANGMPTNGVILWPDSTYGAFTATINPTWFALDGFVLTYTNGGKTITQPTVARDALGNVTNAPALVITP